MAVIATFIGYVFAYAITRTNVPCKGFLKTIATLPILSPPFILCLSIIFLFGRQGLITNGLLKITDNDVYGMGSLIVVQVLSFFPIAYMTLSGILSSIDASVEDAACNMGRQPLAHLLDGDLPPVPAGHHLRLPAGVHPVPGGLLQPRHHRRRLHHAVPWRCTRPSPAATTCRRAPRWRC